MNWILARLREPSSWRGIAWLLTAFGLSLSPDQADAIVRAGMALAGLLGVFLSDERPDSVERAPVGRAGDSAAPGADSGDADLPAIELVGKPVGTSQREIALSPGGDNRRPVPDRPADELRESMSVPPESAPRSYSSADPNTYPRFGSGFGDRD